MIKVVVRLFIMHYDLFILHSEVPSSYFLVIEYFLMFIYYVHMRFFDKFNRYTLFSKGHICSSRLLNSLCNTFETYILTMNRIFLPEQTFSTFMFLRQFKNSLFYGKGSHSGFERFVFYVSNHSMN